MDAFSHFEKNVNSPVGEQQPTPAHKIDRQGSIDLGMKKKWKVARDAKEKTAALIATNEMVLHDLNRLINHAKNDLGKLMEQYGRLSLSGSFLGQLSSTVRLLEQRYERDRTGQFHLQQVLDDMKRKLEFLNNAKESAQKESVG